MSNAIVLEDELTIYNASKLKNQFIELVASGDSVSLDLSQVSEMDLSGLQLLLALRAAAETKGMSLSFINPSHVVTEVIELCHTGDSLQGVLAA